MHELNIHKIRPEKSNQAIGPELQVTQKNHNYHKILKLKKTYQI